MNPHDWDMFVPFEKQIYLDMLADRVEQEAAKSKKVDNNFGMGEPTRSEFE